MAVEPTLGPAAPSLRRVSLTGTGAATLERDGRAVPFRYPAKDPRALLNELCRFRFVDMPASFGTRYSVVLRDDGALATSALKMADAAHATICFTVASFEKCFTFPAAGPRELDDFARRVFSETGRLVKPGGTGR